LISEGLIKGYFFVTDQEETSEPDMFLTNLTQYACKYFPKLHWFQANLSYGNTLRCSYFFSLESNLSFSSPLTPKEQALYWYPEHIKFGECDNDESINTYTYFIRGDVGKTWRNPGVEFDSILVFESTSELSCDITTFLNPTEYAQSMKDTFNLHVGYCVSFNYAYVEKKLKEKTPFTEVELEKISEYFKQSSLDEVSTRVKQNKRKQIELLTKYEDMEKCIKAAKLYNANRYDSANYQIVKNLDKEIDENW
jgi:hypothetical protein